MKRPCYMCETGEGTHLLHAPCGLWPVWLCKDCAEKAKREQHTVEEGPRK